MAYSTAINQRFMQPHFAGDISVDADHIGYMATVGAQQQGVVLSVLVAVNLATQQIDAAQFKVYGCGACIAVADLLCERLIGLSLKQVQSFNTQDLGAELDLPMAKMHCTWLAAEALEKMTTDWQLANPID